MCQVWCSGIQGITAWLGRSIGHGYVCIVLYIYIYIYIYISAKSGVVVFMASLLKWGGQSVIIPCYTITPFPCQLTIDPCYTITPFPCQLTIDPCYTITPHKSYLRVHLIWKTEGLILHWDRSSEKLGEYIWQLIWALHLKIWTHIWCPCALYLVHFIWQLWGYIWQLIWTLHLKIWTHFLITGLGLSVHFIWALHLKMGVYLNLSTSSVNLGLSVHFIWNPGEYIWELTWALHLTSWPSCALHLKTWPNSAICFKWAFTDNIDQQRLHLLSLAVSQGGISESLSGYFIWKFEFPDL